MAVHTDRFQSALEMIQRLPVEEQQRLIERLTHELEAKTAVTPLALSGKWAGVSLSAEEIDEARRECWAGLGDEA
ncbi:hypothetical protein HYR99_08115 [Candidatus Poribacteria bacterium]|nr:hypothetical protein [Candidatus Poribacteria bacterium]